MAETPIDENMACPFWRICNIYTIRSKQGEPIPFRPNAEQIEVLRAIYEFGLEYIIIPKARQLGMSTLIAIVILDSMLFGAGLQCSIVDATGADAKKKLDEKIKFAWKHLDPALRARYEEPTDNKDEWRVKLKRREDEPETAESWVFAGERARGGTNQILWISEWGTIGLQDKLRSTEILTGALPSAKHPGCITIVETTWKGGRQGDLWPIVAEALKTPERSKGPKDARVLFFAWWTNPDYTDHGDPAQIRISTHEYFNKLETILRRQFTNAQRLWWQKTSREQGMFMGREYPSTLDECFEAPTEGAFFDKEGLEYIHRTVMAQGPFVRHCDILINNKGALWVPREASIAPFRIWEDPIEGCYYILSADFCIGKQATGSSGKRDANSWSVWRSAYVDPVTRQAYKAKKVAACCLDDRCSTPEAVRRLQALAMFYGDCTTIPEINNKDNICGQLTTGPNAIKKMWTQRVGADGAMPGTVRTDEVMGWLTNEGTRRQMLATLQQAVMQQELEIPDERMYSELCTFIVNEKGRAEAAPGCFDDSVLEGAIGIHNIVSASIYRLPELESAEQAGGRNWTRFTQDMVGI